MPPRRSSSRTAGQQSTLSFSNSRVTKPSATTAGSAAAAKHKQIKDTKPEPIAKELLKEATSDTSPVVSVPGSPAVETPKQEDVVFDLEPQTEEDRRALEVTEAAIKKYWNEEERSRSAPRIHQQDLDMDEKILRHFDLSSQYGPCIGISRLKRWRRAHMLDLNPPIEVLAVLLKQRRKPVKERAYVDELLS